MDKKEKKNGASFYIALCCCVAVIGLVGYVGRINATRRSDTPSTDVSSADIASTDTLPAQPPVISSPTFPPSTPAPKKVTPTQPPIYIETAGTVTQPTPAPTPEPTPKIEFTQPCSGKIIADMSTDTLEYNKVLGDWRTHNGVDIALSENEQIKAVHSGTVTEIYSGALGETVIVDCGNGFTVVYGCLSGTQGITVGQEIASGFILGTSGNTGSENTTDPHLHLELIKDGEVVNPKEYIPFAS